MKKIGASILCLFLFTGCDASLKEYVSQTRPQNLAPDSPDVPIEGDSTPMSLKVSPGHGTATSADSAMSATVTPTSRRLRAGSDMSAELTINRSRVSH